MDIKDKLSYYKSKTKSQESRTQIDIPPSLKAMAEEFNAEICQPLAPYLKISRVTEINPDLFLNSDSPFDIDLTFLDKGNQSTSFSLNQCLFFDLETTGLMGGTGTFAFLLGFATIADKRIKIDQYFLPDFGREYYLFKELNEFFKFYKYLISFNGKSYDFPLLKSRYIMNQTEPAFTGMIHHDLLHLARRVWKTALPACDLISLEENILNRHRNSDIPGWLIPQSYFDFLNTGLIHEMIRIIEHNYFDLVSLAELTLVLNRISRQPASEKNSLVLQQLASIAFKQDAIEIYDEVCLTIERLSGRISHSLMMDKSRMHKRRNDWKSAVQIWETLIESGDYTFAALDELAKYYEHQKKDNRKALEYTSRALKALDLLDQLERYDLETAEHQRKFNHRRQRLVTKLS